MHTQEESISIEKPRQIVEKEQPLEAMEIIYVELEAKVKAEMQSEMLETMRSLKDDLEILKVDNVKVMNSKSYQEEINEIFLKI